MQGLSANVNSSSNLNQSKKPSSGESCNNVRNVGRSSSGDHYPVSPYNNSSQDVSHQIVPGTLSVPVGFLQEGKSPSTLILHKMNKSNSQLSNLSASQISRHNMATAGINNLANSSAPPAAPLFSTAQGANQGLLPNGLPSLYQDSSLMKPLLRQNRNSQRGGLFELPQTISRKSSQRRQKWPAQTSFYAAAGAVASLPGNGHNGSNPGFVPVLTSRISAAGISITDGSVPNSAASLTNAEQTT